PCVMAPQDLSQWYELWSGGGCQRRCDGYTATVPGKNGTEQVECLCDPEHRECPPHTRLSVFLHQLPGVGVWRLESLGYYAAAELPGQVEFLIGLAKRGVYSEASIAIVEREIKQPGQPTKRFIVPEIRVKTALAQLMTGEVIDAPALPEPVRALPAHSNGNGLHRGHQAMRSSEQAPSYAGASGAAVPNTADLATLKNRCTEHLKALGRTTKGSREYFSATLERDLPSLKDWDDRDGWAELERRLNQASARKTRAYAQYGELCKLIAISPQDRELRLGIWATLLERDALASSGDLLPREWHALVDALGARIRQERELQEGASEPESGGAAAVPEAESGEASPVAPAAGETLPIYDDPFAG
ncbi:MAG TPA: hypothetical protein VFU47_05035, partial [Armatimonadota bacterium]|nr:hypothetical protein [Armatimonadota bacterium]